MNIVDVPDYNLRIDTDLGRDESVADIEKQLEGTDRSSYCSSHSFSNEDYICIARNRHFFTQETLVVLYVSHPNGKIKEIKVDKADKFGHTYRLWKRGMFA